MNLGIILNFAENGKHGCRFNCSFCNWKLQPESKQLLKPSKEDIDKLLEGKKQRFITISGGGDPLFNYEKNKDYLMWLISYLKDKGLAVEIITKEIDILKDNIHDFEGVYFSFSSEIIDQKLLELLKMFPKDRVRISKLYSKNFKGLIDFIDFYAPFVRNIFIRENYLQNLNKVELKEYNKEIGNYKNSLFLTTKMCSKQHLLVGSEIRKGF